MFNPQEHSQPIAFLTFLFIASLLLSAIASAAPSITLSRETGPPTSRILVSGRGFAPNVGVDIFFNTKDEALVVTNGQGEFNKAKIHAPRSARPGEHWVTAIERNDGKGAQQPFLVFTDWPQTGFDLSKSGLNPYENVLDKNTVRDLKVDWSYSVKSSYGFSSVAVVRGVAYATFTGAASYGLNAFNVKTGALLWTYSGAASSPAVEDGIVYVNDSRNLDALDARTGKLLWAYGISDTGTTGAAPTVADGRVFIGAGSGDFYALNATTGALLWKDNLQAGGQVFAGPAVANGVVYICPGYQAENSSVCYALDESSGTPLWTYVVDGFVSGSPVVLNGLVFFDALYTGTYALDATTGALVWNYMEDPFEASPAVASGVVYTAGTSSIGMRALDAYSGALLWSFPTDNGLRCQPAVANGVVYLTSAGGTFYALDAGTGTLLASRSLGADGSSCPTVTNGEVYASGFTGSSAVAQIFAFRPQHALRLNYSSQWQDAIPKRPDLKTLRPDFNLTVSKPGQLR